VVHHGGGDKQAHGEARTYRHYKGKDYQVIGCAKHSETGEEFVVYRALYGKRGLWIRPKAMFLDTVTVDGKPVPRFKRLQKRPS
jgi:hypothetical protein